MNPRILIGSKAIAWHFPDFPRKPKDTDYAVKVEIKSGRKDVEYLYNPVLFERGYGNQEVLEPNALYTLKVSHLFWDIDWEKHLDDVIFLHDKGCTLDYSLFKALRKFWEEYLPTVRRSDLKMTKEDFFTNKVNEDVDSHDDLHRELSAISGLTPAFEDILVGEVEVCEDKWSNLSYWEKVRVVQEETCIMTLERIKEGQPLRLMFQKQLNSCIMKHFPEFIAIFAIQNYKSITIIPDHYLEFGLKHLKNELRKI